MSDIALDGVSIDSYTAAELMAPTNPPAYTSDDECMKTPSPPKTPAQGFQELVHIPQDKPIALPAPKKPPPKKRHSSSSEDSDDDDDDYTEDEIAVLTYIDAFKPTDVAITPELRPFSIEYIPAFGDVDTYVKVPRPDEVDDNIGLTQIDEPPVAQTDAAIVEMQIIQASKETGQIEEDVVIPVKVLQKPEDNEVEIKKWVSSIKELQKSKPATIVKYNVEMPSVDTLMQEHDPKMEKALNTIALPSSDLDCSLEEYVDICLNLVDIPVKPGSRIQGLHMFFNLLQTFNSNQHFKNLQHNQQNGESSSGEINCLEL